MGLPRPGPRWSRVCMASEVVSVAPAHDRPAQGQHLGDLMTGAAIKTIAVHLPTAGLCERFSMPRSRLPKRMARRSSASTCFPAVVVYADATVSMSTEFIVAQQEAFQEDARAVEAAFRARLADAAGVAHEWSASDTGEEPTMRAAATACNTADLVVATQYHDSIPAASGYSPDELVLGTGRPVLIVPTPAASRRRAGAC